MNHGKNRSVYVPTPNLADPPGPDRRYDDAIGTFAEEDP